jgi:hypothetical protein
VLYDAYRLPDKTFLQKKQFRPTCFIEDAWKVLMKLVGDGWKYEVFSVQGGHVCVFEKGRLCETSHSQETPEMAICEAARKVVERE